MCIFMAAPMFFPEKQISFQQNIGEKLHSSFFCLTYTQNFVKFHSFTVNNMVSSRFPKDQ